MRFAIGVLRIFHGAVASGPTAPRGFFGIVHAGGNEIEESHGVAFLLPMRGVGGIERAERSVTSKAIAHEIESTRASGDAGEAMVPALAVHGRAEGVDPQRKRRIDFRGVIAKFI